MTAHLSLTSSPSLSLALILLPSLFAVLGTVLDESIVDRAGRFVGVVAEEEASVFTMSFESVFSVFGLTSSLVSDFGCTSGDAAVAGDPPVGVPFDESKRIGGSDQAFTRLDSLEEIRPSVRTTHYPPS